MQRTSTIAALAASLALVAGAAGPIQGQSALDFTGESNWFVGFSASPPQQMAGVATAVTFARLGGWGLLADMRFTTDSPRGDIFLSGRSPDDSDSDGDIFRRERSTWTSLGLSAVRGLTPEFAVYAGGGVTWETVYIQYEDGTRERAAPLGFYWVEDEEQSVSHPNVLLGVMMRMGNRLAVQVGGQTAPRSFVLGGYVRIL
jgi:hypothetical protein